MGEIRLNVHENMTKVEEIETIQKFCNALPSDTYLRTILKGVVGYCEEQINNDWNIGLVEAIATRDVECKEWEGKFEALQKDLEGTSTSLKEARLDAVNLRNIAREWLDKYDTLSGERNDLIAQVVKLEVEKNRAEADIIKLKARLFDYMMQGEKQWIK